MTLPSNPWIDLENLSKRRVKATLDYNVFWIVDASNKYGLMIQFDQNFIPKHEIKLKGIEIKWDNSTNPNKLIMLLLNNEDWEIFLVLCNDLISEMEEKSDALLDRILKRLIRWQKLLQKASNTIFSKEVQMGLYSELKVLQEYMIPNIGYSAAIQSWVGSLGDKQDFLLENFAIEVKSYRITADNAVWISSKEQLNSEKTPLYLFACALREGNQGETISDLITLISSGITDGNVLNDFVDKVEKYGYFSELEQSSLFRFSIEKVTAYLVEEEFPRISIESVSPWIDKLKYKINLSGCIEYKIEIENLFK